jgi:hypothetical protein
MPRHRQHTAFLGSLYIRHGRDTPGHHTAGGYSVSASIGPSPKMGHGCFIPKENHYRASAFSLPVNFSVMGLDKA